MTGAQASDSIVPFFSAPRFKGAAILLLSGKRQRGKNRPAFYNTRAAWHNTTFSGNKQEINFN